MNFYKGQVKKIDENYIYGDFAIKNGEIVEVLIKKEDINSIKNCFVSKKQFNEIFAIGTEISASIKKVNRGGEVRYIGKLENDNLFFDFSGVELIKEKLKETNYENKLIIPIVLKENSFIESLNNASPFRWYGVTDIYPGCEFSFIETQREISLKINDIVIVEVEKIFKDNKIRCKFLDKVGGYSHTYTDIQNNLNELETLYNNIHDVLKLPFISLDANFDIFKHDGISLNSEEKLLLMEDLVKKGFFQKLYFGQKAFDKEIYYIQTHAINSCLKESNYYHGKIFNILEQISKKDENTRILLLNNIIQPLMNGYSMFKNNELNVILKNHNTKKEKTISLV